MKASFIAATFAAILPSAALAQDSAPQDEMDQYAGCFPVETSTLTGIFCADDPAAKPTIIITPDEMIAETPGVLLDLYGYQSATCTAIERLTSEGEIYDSIVCNEIPFYKPGKVEPIKPSWPNPEISA